ncbi:MAG TPA: LPS export ABC transporter permease LptG [Nitrospiraceae bacterium]|nr:LPS export ABC transporter permease LptG [Nitrospiraceae bacterium]
MPILFRYLLREYAKIFTMCFSGLMTIYLVIDFFEKVRRFLRYDANWLDVMTYFLLKTPAISFQIAPLAILMATLLKFGLLSRGHEITAMRSCGISLLWITSPFIVFATGIALVLLLFSSTVIPLAATKSEEIRTTRIEKKLPAAAVKLKQPWTRVGADSLMHVTSVSVDGELLGDVRFFQFDPNFQLAKVTEADEARYRDSTWTLYQGRHRLFSADGTMSTTPFDRQPIVLTLIPDDFTTWLAGDSELMTFHDIRAYSRRRHQQGAQTTRLSTDYYSRIAFPFVTVVMVLVGIALSLRRSGTRGGSMAMGIGQALAVGFCYWATHSIAIALGRGGVLTPLIAAWMANILFMSFGLYLMFKVRY